MKKVPFRTSSAASRTSTMSKVRDFGSEDQDKDEDQDGGSAPRGSCGSEDGDLVVAAVAAVAVAKEDTDVPVTGSTWTTLSRPTKAV